jgi:modulator of FtsH protease
MQGWTDFAVAAAGATAALAGLVIVGISVNIKEILASPALVIRGAVTIAGLVVALIATLALLVPQGATAVGVELLVVTAFGVAIESRALLAELRQRPRRSRWEMVSHVALAALWIVPFLVAGILLCVQQPGGVYALAFGVGAAIVAAIVNTWVLLVEVLR